MSNIHKYGVANSIIIKNASAKRVSVLGVLISNSSPNKFKKTIAINDVVIEKTILLPKDCKYEYFTCRNGKITSPTINNK